MSDILLMRISVSVVMWVSSLGEEIALSTTETDIRMSGGMIKILFER